MSDKTAVKRYTIERLMFGENMAVNTEVILASDYDALQAKLREAMEDSHAWEDTANWHKKNEDELRKALEDAIECVESWSGYASEYFQDKHDLKGDLSRLRAALATLGDAP
jgi:lipopolysaccharide biosynthesis protein